jgi:uncharacterized protein (TIGR02271 family)
MHMATKRKSKSSSKTSSNTAELEQKDSEAIAKKFETQKIVIPVSHEQLQVGKRQIIKGKVRLHKTVEEQLETVTLPLQSETLEVVRVPKGEMVTEAGGSRQEGNTLVLPIYEEVLVVEKKLRLVEEVRITTKRSQRNEVQEVSLRQERVRLERNGQEVYLEEDGVTL